MRHTFILYPTLHLAIFITYCSYIYNEVLSGIFKINTKKNRNVINSYYYGEMPNVNKEKSYHYQIYHCLKVKPFFHEKLSQKEKNKLLLWIYVRWPSSHLWFNGWRKSPVAGLNWNPWFKNKNLKKARMHRTWLRNIFLRNKFGEKWIKTNIGIFLPGSPEKQR